MIPEKIFIDVEEYIGRNYIEPLTGSAVMADRCAAHEEITEVKSLLKALKLGRAMEKNAVPSETDDYMGAAGAMPCASVPFADVDYDDLDSRLKVKDESFTEMLLRKIDEAGITDAQCYKKAQVSRSHFNKIKLNEDYRIQKGTVLAFILALELGQGEADEMMTKAGYAFSPSDKRDLIVQFCIENKIYDVMQVNEILFHFDQQIVP